MYARVRTLLSAANLVAVGSVVMATMTAGSASTAERSGIDHPNDVWSWVVPASGRGHFVRSGATTNVDLTTVAVRVRERTVTMRFRYVDLRRSGPAYGVTVDLRTDDRTRRHVSFTAHRSDGWSGAVSVLGPWLHSVGCTGQRSDVDYRRDELVLTVPSRCLGDPSWVRFKATAFRLGPGHGMVVDSPRTGRPLPPRWSARAS